MSTPIIILIENTCRGYQAAVHVAGRVQDLSSDLSASCMGPAVPGCPSNTPFPIAKRHTLQ